MITKSTFQPARWISGRHAQTIWPHYFRVRPSTPTRSERLELPDGDFVDLEWTTANRGPITIILHGLGGSIRSTYAIGLMKALHQCGWRACLMHFRGCSGTPNRLARSYHSGDTGDLDTLVQVIRSREPNTPLTAVGYSMGGNVLLKWLGEKGKQTGLEGAVAVSVPIRLEQASQFIMQGSSRLYQRFLVNRLRKSYRSKFAKRNDGPVTRKELAKLKNFPLFDEHITAPLHGFRNAQDYYQRASSYPFLQKIAIPTLILHAQDDPFTGKKVLPREEDLSDQVTLELSERGGHVGFVAGKWPWQAHYWLEERIPEFLRGCL